MKTFLGFFAAGLFIAWTAATLGILGPSKAFANPEWFDQGIRLFRDDQEMKYYYSHGTWIAKGGIPYSRTYQQEYPPLGVVFFSLPRLFTDDFRRFEALFVLLTAFCYAVLVGLTAALLRGFGRRPYRLGLLLLPAFLYFSLWRFDVFPAVLVAGSLLAVRKGKVAPALMLMFLAALAKWYAVLFFLPLFMYLASTMTDEKKKTAIWSGMAALAAITVVSAAAITVMSGFGALADPVLYHLSRNFEHGAFGTSVILALQQFGVAGRVPNGIVSVLFLVLQFAAAVPLVLYGRIKDPSSLVRACIFVLIPFMVFGHFFSAQWIVWLAPLALLVVGGAELALLVALDLVIFLLFPVLFGIDPYTGLFGATALVRTVLLSLLWCFNLRAMRKAGSLVFRLK